MAIICRTHPATNDAKTEKSGQIYTVRATYTYIIPLFNDFSIQDCELIGHIVLRLDGNTF